MKRLLSVICVVLLTIGIGGCGFNSDKNYDEYNKRLKELRKEKEGLEKELSDIKSLIQANNIASTIILLSDTSKNHLNDAIKILDSYEKTAVIALDKNHDPRDNKKDYLNDEEIKGLCDRGYELAIKANKDSDIKELVNYYSDYDIKAVYYPMSDYVDKQIEDIKELGIKSVISFFDYVENEDIISFFSVGSKDSKAKDIYENLIADEKNVSLNIGYENKTEIFSKSNVESMIKAILNDQDKNKTELVSIEEAIEKVTNKQELENIEELNERIEKINKRLFEITEDLISDDRTE